MLLQYLKHHLPAARPIGPEDLKTEPEAAEAKRNDMWLFQIGVKAVGDEDDSGGGGISFRTMIAFKGRS